MRSYRAFPTSARAGNNYSRPVCTTSGQPRVGSDCCEKDSDAAHCRLTTFRQLYILESVLSNGWLPINGPLAMTFLYD